MTVGVELKTQAESVKVHIKTLGTKSWTLKVQERKEWMVILKKVNAELGSERA
jgi:hypothetical protein